MSRIRSVKPEFFRHEGLQELGALPMLFFAGLWTTADRHGVFPWKPKHLKLDILPFTDYDPSKILDDLESSGFIERFESDGRSYGFIPSWLDHQRISGKEAEGESKYPLPLTREAPEKHPRSDGEAPEKHPEPPLSPLERERERDKGKGAWRGKGGAGGKGLSEDSTALAVPPNPHHAFVREIFEQSEKAKALMYQDKASTGREMKAIKIIADRAEKIAPGLEREFLEKVTGTFRQLVNSKLKGKTSYLPSQLMNGWVWALVIDLVAPGSPGEDSPAVRIAKKFQAEKEARHVAETQAD